MQSNRSVYLIIGYLLAALAVGMWIPLLLDFAQGSENWQSFLAASGITSFVAISLILTNRGDLTPLTVKHAFLLTNGSWLALVTFSALPLMLGENHLSFTDAFFEAMSGLTTTGSTVLTGLDTMASGTLLWPSQFCRCLTLAACNYLEWKALTHQKKSCRALAKLQVIFCAYTFS
jgi:trk system potassium uptake protein